jgi:ribonuclease HIII
MKSVEEMIAVVQCYIHLLKNKEVNIIIRNNNDMILLHVAYNKAIQYFIETGTILTLIK